MATSSVSEIPHAIRIAECKGTKFEINVDGLFEIFQKPELQNIPISIIAIAGAFRGGKSFILNFFLRYLRRKGYKNKNWMGNQYEPLIDGFEWKYGEDSCTDGILIWSEIFYVMKDGKKVAIMLMDTQGLFDNESDKNVYTRIFALSTLISSVQIFNLSQQIKANDLEYLELFTTYAQAARGLKQKSIPFQTFVFLIRDFPFGENYGFGLGAGNDLLQKVLDKKSSARIKEHLNTTFSDIKCFTLPHPGKKVATTSKFKGSLKDIDADFLHHTAALVEEVLKPQNIVVKTIAGNVVYAKSFLLYMDGICGKFSKGKLPDIQSMTESTIETQNFQAQNTCIEEYHKIMEKDVTNDYVKQDALLKMHQQAKSEVLKLFETMTKLGEEHHKQKHREYLISKSEDEYKRLLQINKSRKIAAELKIKGAVMEIKKTYETAMNQVTEGTRPIDDKTLNEGHKKYFAEANQSWKKIEGPKDMKTKYFQELEDFMENKIEKLTRMNDEKKRIAKAEKQDREARNKCWDIRGYYTKEWNTKMKEYINESDFQKYDKNLRETCQDNLERGLVDLGFRKGTPEFDDHVMRLKKYMDEDLSAVKTRNSDHKDLLETGLEKNRSEAYADYDKKIKELLNDTYMEEQLLRIEHDEIVEELLKGLKKDEGESSIISNHVKKAKEEFEYKYSNTKRMNQSNYSYFIQFFKFFKNVFTKIKRFFKKFTFS